MLPEEATKLVSTNPYDNSSVQISVSCFNVILTSGLPSICIFPKTKIELEW